MNDFQEAHAAIDAEIGLPQDAQPTLPAGAVMVGAQVYMKDPKGALVPRQTVKPQHLLEDEVVRKILGYAEPLSAQIARFREHTFDDVDAFVGLLEQQYQAKRGGSKGNITLTSFDGLRKVVVQVADLIEFGPELQVAKGLVDDCLREWSTGAPPQLQAVVQRAFNVEKAGLVNRADLLFLLRMEISDDRWQRAMQAIRDSMRSTGTKRYVRIYRRSAADAPWEAVSIDAATA